jgi:uncharacterized caspase-like protein
MLRFVAIFVLALMAGGLASRSWAAERRIALVIGNGAYVNTVKLPNPPTDARKVAAKLKELGFDVTAGYDLNVRDMQALVSKFSLDAATANVAFVFYAGHGMQVDGTNWLIPTDADLQNTTELKFQAIKADDVLDAMPQEPAVRILALDACRDNPFKFTTQHGTRGVIGRGLAAMNVPDSGSTRGGTIIVYATDANQVAYDGVGGVDSPFTTALVSNLDAQDTDIQSMLTQVVRSVKVATNNQQRPWLSVSMNEVFKLNPTPAPANPQQVASLPSSAPALAPSDDDWKKEQALWDSALKDGSVAGYQAYLDKYPNGQFAVFARNKLETLSKAPPAAPAPAPTANLPASPTRAPIEIPPAIRTTAVTEGMEVDTKMSSTDRVNVQRRLTALGYSTGGTDGSFGPMTRGAIRGWQQANAIVATGFLNQPQYDLLIRMSDPVLAQQPTTVAQVPVVTRTVVIAPRPAYARRPAGYRPAYYDRRPRPAYGYSPGAGDAGAFVGGILSGFLRH